MANNRMYLKNTRTGDLIYLAKYYPSLGWFAPDNIGPLLNAQFDEADFGHLTPAERAAKAMQPGLGQPYSGGGVLGDEWEIEYEVRTDG